MNELTIGIIAFCKLVLVAITALLYMMGGRDGITKGVRRFIAPAILYSGVLGFAFINGSPSIPLISSIAVSMGLLMASYTLGYGASTIGEKIIKRFIFGLLVGGSSIALAIVSGSYVLFALQVVVSVIVTVVMGVLNPVEAAEEESIIGFMGCVFVPFML